MNTCSTPKVYITRRETFSSAHRLHSTALSDEDNMHIFGKCNNPNGHGHNYVLEVTVVGHVDEHAGMVMNIADLKHIIQEHVLKLVDHKHLDLDLDHFRINKIVSTTENLAIYIWQQLTTAIRNQSDKVHLYEIKLHETENNIVVYRGE
ncbi:unnamed protein product [Adineta ricciae]|uniref:6-pyruvoyltetrahydropterin synthase n=2 Tax=Adineta ricciae TaxID=249248 RepID=A0A815W9M7_ADIRI|nr:unnamed protein product [Adineta ricciae]